MSVVITIMVYAFQLFCTCAMAAVVWFIIAGLLKLFKVKTSKRTAIICLAVILVVLCAVLAYVCENPVVTCPDEYADVVTEEQMRDVQSIASGIYSKRIPLIPIRVNIEKVQWVEMFNEYEIKFRIDYLFFGNVKIIVGGDGISVVKPLGS